MVLNPTPPALHDRLPSRVSVVRTKGWTYTMRNAAVIAGGGTTITGSDDGVAIEDLVTTLTPTRWETLRLGGSWKPCTTSRPRFSSLTPLSASPFTRAVVVDDDSVTAKAYAIRPKTVKAFAVQLVDNWIAEGWSRERDAIVGGIVAEIDAGNAGRINLLVPDVIAAGSENCGSQIRVVFHGRSIRR